MNIKTSEILILNSTQDIIVKKWNQQKDRSNSNNVQNKASKFNLTLRVPFRIKGQKAHMLIDSKLVLSNKKNGVLIKFYASVSKPLIASLLFGIVPSVIFLYFNSSVVLFLFFTLLISLFSFIMFYVNIIKLSKKYINKLKESCY